MPGHAAGFRANFNTTTNQSVNPLVAIQSVLSYTLVDAETKMG